MGGQSERVRALGLGGCLGVLGRLGGFEMYIAEGVMSRALRTILIVIGAGFTLQGIGWLFAPSRAAAGIGMPLLDGLARSTQIGDFAAFFLTLGLGILAGAAPGHARRLYFPAGLLGSAALCRIVAWAVHGAVFATTFIVVEIVACAMLVAGAWQASDLD